jgi:hypothetical protein
MNRGNIRATVHPLLSDPWIAAQVDAAVAPYRRRLPPSEVEWMRDQLAETLSSDERAQKLLRRVRAGVVDESGEVVRRAAGESVDGDGDGAERKVAG